MSLFYFQMTSSFGLLYLQYNVHLTQLIDFIQLKKILF